VNGTHIALLCWCTVKNHSVSPKFNFIYRSFKRWQSRRVNHAAGCSKD